MSRNYGITSVRLPAGGTADNRTQRADTPREPLSPEDQQAAAIIFASFCVVAPLFIVALFLLVWEILKRLFF